MLAFIRRALGPAFFMCVGERRLVFAVGEG